MSNTSLSSGKKLVMVAQRQLASLPNISIQRGALGFLFALHFFGVLGIHVPFMAESLRQLTPFESFLSLTPLNLLLTCGILLLFHKEWNKNFVTFILLCVSVGFFIELLGVSTGLVFGEYEYGGVLGPKLWGTPPMIGVNWLILVYASGSIVSGLPVGNWAKAAMGAALMVGLDVLIEPVAMHFGFWYWVNNTVPMLNYLAWFAVSFVLVFAFLKLKFNKKNKAAIYVFLAQLGFFAANLLLM
ncbi:carotenoid biosynthesis protein [Flammeovirgaceae bacterium SG7u.111]|nr:carotenoid biosynthesis protein [Flammeovirgaceae bacterium SG7u.132]WPO35881.1 carotenoid biosynthesis protein [Flammeovirgaceae bacterium SG7u.111]